MRGQWTRIVTSVAMICGLSIGLSTSAADSRDYATNKPDLPETTAGITHGDMAEPGSSAWGERKWISTKLPSPLVATSPPIVINGSQELQLTKTAATQELINEGFEGTFPPSNWQIARGSQPLFQSCSTVAEVDWSKTSDRASSGSYSIWNARSGNAAPGVGGDSPECTYSWIIVGPFDLSSTTSGHLDWDLYLDTEDDYDIFIWWASTDGQSFSGHSEAQSNNAWTAYTQDLSQFGLDASEQPIDLTGESTVWFAFTYASDHSITQPGAWIDDVVLTVEGGGGGTPPTANFTRSPISPAAGSTVQFTDTSTGSPTSWSWTFDDGGSSTQRNPSHVYTVAGTYSVRLTASNTYGSDSITKTITVTGGGGGGGDTYTTNADFDQGTMVGVEHDSVAHQLQLSSQSGTLPFIWVPNSNSHSISKIDTNTGDEIGRYYVGPTTSNQNSSRTTVDLQGNCWVGNRGTGTAVKVGLNEAGQCYDRNGNGTIQTSFDTNGDGDISDPEMLPWGSDECVLWEVVLIDGATGTYRPGNYQGSYNANYLRAVAIDASNNVWAGVYNDQKYYYINNQTGQIQTSIDVSSTGTHPYGAVIDRNGMLWSASYPDYHVVRINPANGALTKVDLTHLSYGLGVDSNGRLFVSGYYSKMSRINISNATVDWTVDTLGGCKGVALTNDNDVWLAGRTAYQVGRYSNSGTQEATIDLGFGPTGVAVDSNGKVWAMGDTSGTIKRINPTTNTVDLTKDVVGTSTHYGYSDMTGIVARSVTTRLGTWAVNHDSGTAGTQWGTISWNASEPAGTSVTVRVRSSANLSTWSGWEDASNGAGLGTIPNGRYLQIEVTLKLTSGDVSPILYDLTVTPGGGGGGCTLSCSATVPATGQVGSSVSFQSTATPNNCTGTVAYAWTFGDGGTSSVRNPSHTYTSSGVKNWQLTATISGVSCTKSGSITISSGGGVNCNYTYWVPVASHGTGAQGSVWRTDLGLLGAGTATSDVEVRLHRSNGIVSQQTSVGVRVQKVLTDVVDWIVPGWSGSGSLEVCSERQLYVTSRTYNLLSGQDLCAPNGTFGQYLDGAPSSAGRSSGQTLWLPHLRQDSLFRSNIGFLNSGTTNGSFLVTLYNGSGTQVAQWTVTLAPGRWKQVNTPFSDKAGLNNLQRGSAKVAIQSGTGIFVYASVVDQKTNDPTTIPMKW